MIEENQEAVDRLTTLKSRADLMGITYHPNIGPDKLQAKIDARLATDESPDLEPETSAKPAVKGHAMSEKDYRIMQRNQRKREANRLVRVVVTCMDPNKRDWEGEIISVGSAKLGTYKKYVPFNVETGFHVPKIILEAMQERKVTVFHTVRNRRGEKVRKGKLIPAFSIDILDPLTPKELEALKKQQAMARGQDVD